MKTALIPDFKGAVRNSRKVQDQLCHLARHFLKESNFLPRIYRRISRLSFQTVRELDFDKRGNIQQKLLPHGAWFFEKICRLTTSPSVECLSSGLVAFPTPSERFSPPLRIRHLINSITLLLFADHICVFLLSN